MSTQHLPQTSVFLAWGWLGGELRMSGSECQETETIVVTFVLRRPWRPFPWAFASDLEKSALRVYVFIANVIRHSSCVEDFRSRKGMKCWVGMQSNPLSVVCLARYCRVPCAVGPDSPSPLTLLHLPSLRPSLCFPLAALGTLRGPEKQPALFGSFKSYSSDLCFLASVKLLRAGP